MKRAKFSGLNDLIVVDENGQSPGHGKIQSVIERELREAKLSV